MEINHQCRHLLKGEENKVKRNLSRDDTKKTLKTVAEGEIRVNTDEYSIYEGIDELKIVKEHRFVNHSKDKG